MDSLWHCFNHMTREQFQSCWLNQVPNDQLGSPKATTDQPEVPKPRSCRGQSPDAFRKRAGWINFVVIKTSQNYSVYIYIQSEII